MAMNQILNRFLLVYLLGCIVFASLAKAETQDPYQVVQQTTEQVLVIVKDAKGYSAKEPQRFIAEVTPIMDKVIDFDHFARSVMGTYASGQRYKALTSDADKAAFRERIQRFSTKFKEGIVDTYATGLMNFNGSKVITLPPPKGDDPATGSATVMQHIFNESGKPYVVQYTMRRNKAGEWKLRNLIIEGINLGLTYRNQFSVAADKYQGDIDKVIANWQVEPNITITDKTDATKAEKAK
jgi:phospholipid transport system substrate-binding protein